MVLYRAIFALPDGTRKAAVMRDNMDTSLFVTVVQPQQSRCIGTQSLSLLQIIALHVAMRPSESRWRELAQHSNLLSIVHSHYFTGDTSFGYQTKVR